VPLSSFFSVVEVVVSVGEVDPVTKNCMSDTIFLFSPTAVMIQILILPFFLILFKKF